MNYIGIALLVLMFLWFIFGIVKIKQYERGIKERLGRFIWQLDPGWHMIIPFIDRVIKVDMRERVIQTPPQEMITKDNAVVTVDAVVFAEITTPNKAVYEIQDPFLAVTNLAMTTLRAIIWTMTLDEVLWERAAINVKVQTEISQETAKWWVRINKIEIQRIDPPRDLMEAMNQQKIAQQEKRAAILRAEWQKEAAIREAEWKKQSAILKAEGEKQSQILRAEWEAQAIERLAAARAKALQLEATAAIQYFKDNAVLKEQLKVLGESLKNNTKYVLDSDMFKLVKNFMNK